MNSCVAIAHCSEALHIVRGTSIIKSDYDHDRIMTIKWLPDLILIRPYILYHSLALAVNYIVSTCLAKKTDIIHNTHLFFWLPRSPSLSPSLSH